MSDTDEFLKLCAERHAKQKEIKAIDAKIEALKDKAEAAVKKVGEPIITEHGSISMRHGNRKVLASQLKTDMPKLYKMAVQKSESVSVAKLEAAARIVAPNDEEAAAVINKYAPKGDERLVYER